MIGRDLIILSWVVFLDGIRQLEGNCRQWEWLKVADFGEF
jgi:hypothetical protein